MQTYWKTKRENSPIKKPMKAMNARLSSVVAQLETLLTQWQPVCLSTGHYSFGFNCNSTANFCHMTECHWWHNEWSSWTISMWSPVSVSQSSSLCGWAHIGYFESISHLHSSSSPNGPVRYAGCSSTSVHLRFLLTSQCTWTHIGEPFAKNELQYRRHRTLTS